MQLRDFSFWACVNASLTVHGCQVFCVAAACHFAVATWLMLCARAPFELANGTGGVTAFRIEKTAE